MLKVRIVGAVAAVIITCLMLVGSLLIADYGERLFAQALGHFKWWWMPLFNFVLLSTVSLGMLALQRRRGSR